MSWNWADHAKPYIKIHINFKIYLTISIIKDCKYKGEKKELKIRLLIHLEPYHKKHSIFFGLSPS